MTDVPSFGEEILAEAQIERAGEAVVEYLDGCNDLYECITDCQLQNFNSQLHTAHKDGWEVLPETYTLTPSGSSSRMYWSILVRKRTP
jgi:hypothetical protein